MRAVELTTFPALRTPPHPAQVIASLLVLVTAIISIVQPRPDVRFIHENEWAQTRRLCSSLGCLFTTMKFLEQLRAISMFGPFIYAIGEIMAQLIPFVLTLVLVMIGFGGSFFALLGPM